MDDVSTITPCPSCGAPLSAAGKCTHCGSQSRGFWNDLDLGVPELADAVIEGLDYYLVLDAAADSDMLALSDAYVARRRRFPDDPRQLHPQVARQLGLLEEAWRILSVPERRAVYDRLLAAQERGVRGLDALIRALNCSQCGAPFEAAERFCGACGSPRHTEAAAAPQQPVDAPVDYYAVLGVQPQRRQPPAEHWGRGLVEHDLSRGLFGLLLGAVDLPQESAGTAWEPPSADDLRLAYLARQRELLLRPDPEAALGVEVAYRVLSDEARRTTYDSLMNDLRERGWTSERLRALSGLNREVRSELTAGAPADGTDLLEQGQGYLKLNLPGKAAPLLERAAAALPESAEAQYSYATAVWRSADLAALTPHQLRQIAKAFEAAARLEPRAADAAAPFVALCAAMLLYNDGAIDAAREQFAAVAARFPAFAPAWRMCAATALLQNDNARAEELCERAYALDPECEPVLLLAIGAAMRQGKRDAAQIWARRAAGLRGADVRAADVLRELGFR